MGFLYNIFLAYQFTKHIDEANKKKSSYLNVSKYNADKLPETLFQCCNLEKLYLQKNKISCLDSEISQLFLLNTLALDYNHLEHLPCEISNLYNLESLNVSHNPLKKLPQELGALGNLQNLWCNAIQIDQLPETIGDLTMLDSFGARSNRLTQLPPTFNKLTRLTWLTLENNLLTSLPEGFGDLGTLIHLNLSKNKFDSFPSEILKCSCLKYVYLNSNQISELTLSEESLKHLGDMSDLVYIDLRDNPLTKNSPFKDHLKNFPKLKAVVVPSKADASTACNNTTNNATIEESDFSEWEDTDSTDSLGSRYTWEWSCPSSLIDSEEETDIEVVENEIVVKYLQDISRFVSSGS